ncbi:MAG TPA: choice-of-anchor tandem repeat GloVer-containing protein [Candidatus Methylacidiphilales bacterium]|nr:choice-of-anchor tandem repeat GloVer-containing protein [Candidatus Methylacidiphilales bacterium]
MKTLRILSFLVIGLCAPFAGAQTTTVLHDFTGPDNQSFPYGGLILSGGVLYGTTSGGGSGNTGTVFKINPDGSGKSTLHNFASYGTDLTNSDGAKPHATLLLSGSTLYGTTSAGGSSGDGTVFKVNTDGTGFTVLYTFTGKSDGAVPLANLILSGSTLYGTASEGGSSGYGTVFSLSTTGTNFTVLHNFTDGADGANPVGGLVLSGSTLYGTSSQGGSGYGVDYTINTTGQGFTGYGNIFSISTAGKNFTVLYSFLDAEDGANPEAGLILSGNTLYGTAEYGGAGDGDNGFGIGTIFKINTNGTGFTTLYFFQNYGGDSYYPTAPLVLSGSTLYGTLSVTGTAPGAVFSISTSGTGFTILHNFSATTGGAGINSDGAYPIAGLVLSGGMLYGTTVSGGTGGNGTLYSLSTSGSSFTAFHDFAGGNGGNNPMAGMLVSGGTLYGTTEGGGDASSCCGTVYKVNTDGSGYSTLYSFTGASDGTAPGAHLALSGSTLYGTTAGNFFAGNQNGTIFKINTDGSSFTTLHTFSASPSENPGINSDGIYPEAGLVLSGSTLYGAATYGGTNTTGTLFKINTDGTGFTVLHTFSALNDVNEILTNSDGAYPSGALIVSGSTLYGVAEGGGSKGCGTVFSISTSGTNFTTLYNFTGGSDGTSPSTGLLLSGGTLYGTTNLGGTNGNGTVYSISTSGTGFTLLHTFGSLSSGDNSDGADPLAELTLSGSTLYGTTYSGGAYGNGTVFSLGTNGANFTTLHNFGTLSAVGTNTYGANAASDLVLTGGVLYGTAENGGSTGYGTVFSVTP